MNASRGGRTGSPSPEPYFGARRATPNPRVSRTAVTVDNVGHRFVARRTMAV